MQKTKRMIQQYGNSVAIVNNGDLRGHILSAIGFVFSLLLVAYLFVVSTMILNIIERKSLEHEARILSSEVSELELSYLELVDKIDLDYSYALGFESINRDFAPRTALGVANNAQIVAFAQNEN